MKIIFNFFGKINKILCLRKLMLLRYHETIIIICNKSFLLIHSGHQIKEIVLIRIVLNCVVYFLILNYFMQIHFVSNLLFMEIELELNMKNSLVYCILALVY